MNQYFDNEGRLIVPKIEVHDEDNVVFKCNWNDKEWKGTCSKEAREFNVSKGHLWCIDSLNTCEDSINKKIEDEREVYGNKETSIIINPKIKLKFWNYFKNKDGSNFWGSRQRYFNDA